MQLDPIFKHCDPAKKMGTIDNVDTGPRERYKVVYKLITFANLIAAILCVGVFMFFSSGVVVPLHEGGWIQAYLSIPVTALCLLINLPLGLFIWLVTRSGVRSFKALRYTGLAIGCVSVVGLLVVCLLLY